MKTDQTGHMPSVIIVFARHTYHFVGFVKHWLIYLLFNIYDVQHLDRHSGSVVECPLCDREVAGSIPGRVIPNTLKMLLAAHSLGAQH